MPPQLPAFADPPRPVPPPVSAFEIPLVPVIPSSRVISLAGALWRLTTSWCEPAQIWLLEIADPAGNRVLSGVPLTTGLDLLAQFAYLDFGGQLIAQSDSDYQRPPGLGDLGLSGHLYFVTASGS